MPTLPALFISHGAPDILLRDTPASRFLRGLSQSLPRPRAIVVASAHWTTSAVTVGSAARPDTIHDFGGFGPDLATRRYGAPGDPALAEEVRSALARNGLAATAAARGFDHGVWVPLSLMYPEAQTSVVPISAEMGAMHLAGRRPDTKKVCWPVDGIASRRCPAFDPQYSRDSPHRRVA